MSATDYIAVALFLLATVLGIIGFFVVRFFNSTESHLASIDETLGNMKEWFATKTAEDKTRDSRLDEHCDRLDDHERRLNENDVRWARGQT